MSRLAGAVAAATVLAVAGSSTSVVGLTVLANRVDSVLGEASIASPLNSQSSSSWGMG